MKPKQDTKVEADKLVRDIKRAGLRGEDSIAELCRREGLHQNLYDRLSKEFLETGKKQLTGDTEVRPAIMTLVNCARRYHESLNNLTPEDVWCGRRQSIFEHRCKIKEKTLQLCKQLYFERKTA